MVENLFYNPSLFLRIPSVLCNLTFSILPFKPGDREVVCVCAHDFNLNQLLFVQRRSEGWSRRWGMVWSEQ